MTFEITSQFKNIHREYCFMKLFFLLIFFLLFTLAAQTVPLEPVSATGGAKFRKNGTSLIIDFPAYAHELKNTHPTVNLRLAPDCSAYDGVDVDLRLSGGFSSSLSINFRDAKGKQCFDVQPIADGLRTTLRFNFNPARKMDKKNMKFLRIYLSRPALSARFTIYGIRLFSRLAQQKEKLRQVAESCGVSKELEKISTLAQCEKFTAFLRRKQLDNLIAAGSEVTGSKSLGAGFIPPLCRPLPFYGVLDAVPRSRGKISLAGNETENIHIITVSKTPLKELSASLSGLPSSVSGSIHPAGAVRTRSSRTPGVHTGWHFDPILEYTSKVTGLAPYQLQLWVVRIKLPQPVPGTHRISVNFNADGKKFSLPLDVTGYNFTLPRRKTLRTATSVYGSKLMGKYKKEFEKWLLSNFYLNSFSIYSDSGSYGIPQLPPVQEYLEAVKSGLNFIPIVYLKLPRQAHHTRKKISPGSSKVLWEKMSAKEQSHYPAEWKEKYLQLLRKRVPELKKANLWHYAACYAFDEATPSEWCAIIDLVRSLKKEFPDLKIVSTITDNSYGFRSDLHGIIDEWIPPVWQYNFERAEKARKLKRKVWYYTTRMTVDGTPLARIRTQLGEQAVASRTDGWLVWTVSRWYNNSSPISGTAPLTRWNPESFPGDNGGGSYFCMGEKGKFLSTLRAEAIRDGIEDYEYYTIMMKLAHGRKKNDPLRLQGEKLYKSLSSSENITPVELLKNRSAAAGLIERMR